MTDTNTTVDKTLSFSGKVTDKNVESITGENGALALDVLSMPGSSKIIDVKKEEDEDGTKLKDALTDLFKVNLLTTIYMGNCSPP
jgi:hypothetical protein